MKEFRKENLVKEMLQIAYDMRGAINGENSVGFIQLPDGRTAEVSVKVNTDEDEFILPIKGKSIFILKSHKMKPVELP